MRRELEEILPHLDKVVRPVMLQRCVSNCCIATVSALRQVLRQYGHRSEPLPCEVRIYNPELARRMKLGQRIPEDPDATWFKITGCYSLGIIRESANVGPPIPGGRFGGHLALFVPVENSGLIIDASIAQASRPQYNIKLPQMLRISDVSLASLKKERCRVRVEVNGCLLDYTPILDDQTFRTAVDWREGTHQWAVAQIINRTEDLLTQAGAKMRCDFCMTLDAEQLIPHQAESAISVTKYGVITRDDGVFVACHECEALIQAGAWDAILERALVGTLALNTEIADTTFNRAELKRRFIHLLKGVFGDRVNV